MSDTINQIADFIKTQYEEKSDGRLVFHNFSLTVRLVETMQSLAAECGINDGDTLDVLLGGAWFFNTGYLYRYRDASEESILQARQFLEKQLWPPEKTGRLLLCLKSGWQIKAPEILEEKCFSDAVQSNILADNYSEKAALHRLELELMEQRHFTDEAWLQYQLQGLLATKFYTAAARLHYEPTLARNILSLKNQLEKIQQRKPKQPQAAAPGSFGGHSNRTTERTIQTFFRANFRNHIELSAIADNKANIMISVNAILISVIISILSYRNLTEANPVILMPAIVFLITGLTSLIFAVLSARPKVTSVLQADSPDKLVKNYLVFFGNFVQIDLERYEVLMDEMFKDGSLLLTNLTRDLYHLGKVLDKKYKYLTIAYNIFMVGFVATVVIFLVVLLS